MVKTWLDEMRKKNISHTPVIDLDVLVGLGVVHEPHQLKVKDGGEGEELDPLLSFL
jgi:predicted transcriptional regulator